MYSTCGSMHVNNSIGSSSKCHCNVLLVQTRTVATPQAAHVRMQRAVHAEGGKTLRMETPACLPMLPYVSYSVATNVQHVVHAQ